MRLFAGTFQQVIEVTIKNQIVEKLKLKFMNYFRNKPFPSEVES